MENGCGTAVRRSDLIQSVNDLRSAGTEIENDAEDGPTRVHHQSNCSANQTC